MKSIFVATLFLSLSLVVQFAHSDKILVLSFFSTKSHKITYMSLIEELASRGHQITVVTPVKASKQVPNITEIFTLDLEAIMAGKFDPFQLKKEGAGINPFMMLDKFGLVDICRRSYDLPQVKQLLKQDFDLVFMQPLFNDCALGIVHRIKAPLVLFFPTSVPYIIAEKVGAHFPSSFVPNPFLEIPDEMNFFQRFQNFGMNLFINLVLKFYYEPKMAEIYREKLGQDIPDVSEILGNVSLILSNGHFSLNKPKPYLPDIVDVAGISSKPAQPLPKDLEEFASRGKDGFIFFSLGSAIPGNMMPEDKRKIFLNVFSKLKQQVFWKWETETMPDLPKNVKLSKWLPQLDILGHKNIRMFITHCGGGGTVESIYHGVPLLGVPMLGDQPKNAKRAKNQNILVQVDWNELTEESLMAGIQEILNNNTYRDNVQRLSKIFRDQPENPLQRAAFWVEYILRHKGAPHLRSASRKLNALQYHSVDVIGAYLAIIVTISYSIFATLRFILKKICGGKSKSSNLTSHQKKCE